MNLYVILDKKYIKRINKFDTSGIYLLDDEIIFEGDNSYLVSDIKFDDKIIYENAQKINLLFDNDLCNDLNKFKNNFFTRIYMPLSRIINAIDFLISKHKVSEIILYGGQQQTNFVPYYMAEGEIQRVLLYETPMFVNSHIYKQFKNKVKVTYKYKNSYVKIFLYKNLRRYGLFLFKFLYMFLFHHKLNKVKEEKINFHGNKVVAFPVRSVVQIIAVEDFFISLQSDLRVQPVFFVYEGIMKHGLPASKYLLDKKYDTVQIYKDNIIYKVVINSLIRFIKGYPCKIFLWNGFDIKELTIEMKIANFEKYIYQELLFNKLRKYKNSINYIFSTEIKSPEAFIENKIGQKLNIKSGNSQSQSIQSVPLPSFEMNGEFLFDNKKDYTYFNQFQNSGRFIGTFRYLKILNVKFSSFNNKKNVIFFTQPYEYDNQNKIISLLVTQLDRDQKFIIKPHPRDGTDYSMFLSYDKVSICIQQDLNLIWKDCDIVISRTSTVLLDAILRKKIVFSVITTAFEKRQNIAYIDKKFLCIIDNIDALSHGLTREIEKYNINERYANLRSDFFGDKDFVKNFYKMIDA
jgi:hypothetical protein